MQKAEENEKESKGRKIAKQFSRIVNLFCDAYELQETGALIFKWEGQVLMVELDTSLIPGLSQNKGSKLIEKIARSIRRTFPGKTGNVWEDGLAVKTKFPEKQKDGSFKGSARIVLQISRLATGKIEPLLRNAHQYALYDLAKEEVAKTLHNTKKENLIAELKLALTKVQRLMNAVISSSRHKAIKDDLLDVMISLVRLHARDEREREKLEANLRGPWLNLEEEGKGKNRGKLDPYFRRTTRLFSL